MDKKSKSIDKKKQKRLESEIAENLLDDFDKFEHFALTYWKQIFYACIAIVVIVAGIAIGIQVNSSQKAKVDAAIADADKIDELKKIALDYPNNPSVASVKIKLATLYFNKKEYAEALKVYKSILSSPVPDEMRWRARLNICYIQELEGQKEKAAEGFAAIGSDSVLSEAFRAEANYSSGRIYAELKKTEDARKKLEIAATAAMGKGGSAFWGGQAKVLLERLNAAASAKTAADKS